MRCLKLWVILPAVLCSLCTSRVYAQPDSVCFVVTPAAGAILYRTNAPDSALLLTQPFRHTAFWLPEPAKAVVLLKADTRVESSEIARLQEDLLNLGVQRVLTYHLDAQDRELVRRFGLELPEATPDTLVLLLVRDRIGWYNQSDFPYLERLPSQDVSLLGPALARYPEHVLIFRLSRDASRELMRALSLELGRTCRVVEGLQNTLPQEEALMLQAPE